MTKRVAANVCQAAVVALLLVLSGCSAPSEEKDSQSGKDGGKGEQPTPFSAGQMAAAEKALANGIRIEDPQGDYFQFPPHHLQPDGRPDNDNPYPLPYTDLRSVSVGADSTYLYVRFQYWGKFPTASVVYNGDLLRSVGGKLEDLTFTNSAGAKDSALLSNGINLADHKDGQWVQAGKPSIGQLAMITPVGQDEQQEVIYKTMDGAGLVAGGAGQDYILSAFPLRLFGLRPGDEVTFSCSTETGSEQYHHVCIDFLLGRDGYLGGSIIRYRLGSSDYTVVAVPTDIMG